MNIDLSKPTRTIEWKDSQDNTHIIETYVYGNGCFWCKKFVNGIEEKAYLRKSVNSDRI